MKAALFKKCNNILSCILQKQRERERKRKRERERDGGGGGGGREEEIWQKLCERKENEIKEFVCKWTGSSVCFHTDRMK